MRFTLGKMFLAIAMLALACAGMMYRTGFWASLLFTLTLASLIAAAIVAVRLNARMRLVVLISAVVGIVYLLFVTAGIFRGSHELLLTNYPLAAAAKSLGIVDSAATMMSSPPPSFGGALAPAPAAPASPNYDTTILMAFAGSDEFYSLAHFFVIGHCVFSWFFAVLAAWFAGRMYDRRERAKEAI